MSEYSRMIIEEYCIMNPNTKKSSFLRKLVRLSYKVDCVVRDSDALRLAQYIEQEDNSELKEALIDLDQFLFGY